MIFVTALTEVQGGKPKPVLEFQNNLWGLETELSNRLANFWLAGTTTLFLLVSLPS
jgi:hypothetical protein